MTKLQHREHPTDFSPVYFCPGCEARYTTRKEAVECSGTDEVPTFKVGQIVCIDIRYGWFDGDEKWLVKNGKDDGRQMYAAYFVVTAVDYNRTCNAHRCRYHVKTLGIKNGNPTGSIGYTTSTHYPLQRVPQNPVLVAEGAKFIGETTDHLL